MRQNLDPTTVPHNDHYKSTPEFRAGQWPIIVAIRHVRDVRAALRALPADARYSGLEIVDIFAGDPKDRTAEQRSSFKGIAHDDYPLKPRLVAGYWNEGTGLFFAVEKELSPLQLAPFGELYDFFTMLHYAHPESAKPEDKSESEGRRGGQKHVGMRGSSLGRGSGR